VGTFYGHKVYKTIGDQLPMVSFDEFYIHTNRTTKRFIQIPDEF